MRHHNTDDKPDLNIIGECKCEVCGATGKLILGQGKQFRAWTCICPNGHRPTVKEEIDDIFQIGDRIRYYEKSDYSSYYEGIIVAKTKGIVNYHLDMKIDKAVMNNKPVVKRSWLYGYVIECIDSDSNCIELLTPQMRIVI